MKILLNETGERGLIIENDGWISPENDHNKKILSEAKFNPSEDLILYAILQKYDTPNRNGRIYPEAVLKKEAEIYQQLIDKRSAIAELDHPDTSLIDLDRVSHLIEKIWWDGKMLMGKLKILTSPGWKKMGIISCKGDQAANLLLNGVTLGISSRGVGSLKKEGNQNVVSDDYSLVGFDIVSSPSTPGSYLIFDLNDREKYDESTEHITKEDESFKKTSHLMNKLNNFLSK